MYHQKKNYIIHILGNNSAEEVTHNWQSREVVAKIMNSKLKNLIKMPYKNKASSIVIDNYELFDAPTKKFMLHFKKDIQNINNGKLSPKKFKRKVGKSNFDLFAHAAYLCTTDKSENANFSTIMANPTNDYIDTLYPNRKAYTDIGNKMVENMILTSTKKDKILEKTRNLTASSIFPFGEFFKSKLKEKKHDAIDNSLAR